MIDQLAVIYKDSGKERDLINLINEIKPIIKHFCSTIPVLYREDAEQEVTIEVVRSLGDWDRKKSKFNTWATLRIKRTVIDFYRTLNKVKTEPLNDEHTVDYQFGELSDLTYYMGKLPEYQLREIFRALGPGCITRNQQIMRSQGGRRLRKIIRDEKVKGGFICRA